MRIRLLLFFLAVTLLRAVPAVAQNLTASPFPDFLTQQQAFPRVQQAFEMKSAAIEASLARVGLRRDRLHLLLVAFKAEGILEVWVKDRDSATYRRLRVYPICYRAGSPGPKLYQGDGQVPEGLYYIDRFNPESQFHLSLGLDYPNPADYALSPYRPLGGNIFIHGGCQSIGCLPITDSCIEELYLYAVQACQSGQARIPVYLFPARMTAANMAHLREQAAGFTPSPVPFWATLQRAYDAFITTHREVAFTTDIRRGYVFR